MGHLTKCEWGSVPGCLSDSKGCLAVDVQEYATAQDMMQSTCLKLGYAHTLGFYEVGDGGAAYYTIVASPRGDEPNGMDVLQCRKYVAELVPGKIVTPEQYGAKGDGSTDNLEQLSRCLNAKASHFVIFKAESVYNVSDAIDCYVSDVTIDMNGAELHGTKTSRMGTGTMLCFFGSENGVVTDPDTLSPDNYNHNVVIANGFFSESDTDGDTNCLSAANGMIDFVVSNCVFKNTHRKGFAPQGGYANITIENCIFENCRSGIEFGGYGKNSFARNCFITTDGSTRDVDGKDPAPIYGIMVANSRNAIVENCYVNGYNGDGDSALRIEYSTTYGVEIKNCEFNGGQIGLLQPCKISNCLMYCSDVYVYDFNVNGKYIFDNCNITIEGSIYCLRDNTQTVAPILSVKDSILNLVTDPSKLNKAAIYLSYFAIELLRSQIECNSSPFMRAYTDQTVKPIIIEGNRITGATELFRMTFYHATPSFICNNVNDGTPSLVYAIYGNSSNAALTENNYWSATQLIENESIPPLNYYDYLNGTLTTNRG